MRRKRWSKDPKGGGGAPNCTGFAVYFSQLLVRTRPKLRLHSAKPSAPQSSRSRIHWRNGLKQPTQNTAAKKRARWERTGSHYLFDNSTASLPSFNNSTRLRSHSDRRVAKTTGYATTRTPLLFLRRRRCETLLP